MFSVVVQSVHMCVDMFDTYTYKFIFFINQIKTKHLYLIFPFVKENLFIYNTETA